MNKIEVISREEAQMLMPQAVNCMDFLSRKFLKSLPDELNQKVWIAGGCIRDYFLEGKTDSDFDFFGQSRSDFARLIIWLRNRFGFKHYLITDNAVKGWVEINDKKVKVDIVKKEFSNPSECIDKFDFTVCCFATDGTNFYYHVSAPFDLLKKKLVIHSLPAPVDTLKRLYKYVQKGFKTCNGTLMTLAKAIAELDPSDESVFEFYKFD